MLFFVRWEWLGVMRDSNAISYSSKTTLGVRGSPDVFMLHREFLYKIDVFTEPKRKREKGGDAGDQREEKHLAVVAMSLPSFLSRRLPPHIPS